MTKENAFIYPEQKTYGITHLEYQNFISHSYISILTLETLLNWNEVLKLRMN